MAWPVLQVPVVLVPLERSVLNVHSMAAGRDSAATTGIGGTTGTFTSGGGADNDDAAPAVVGDRAGGGGDSVTTSKDDGTSIRN